MYNQFLQTLQEDGHIINPEDLSTFNVALSLRSAAPRIEAHYQYYTTAVEPALFPNQQCPEWIMIDGKQYCSPEMTEAIDTTLTSTYACPLNDDLT